MGRLRDAQAGQDTTDIPLVIFAGAGASAHLGFLVGSELTQRVERTAAQDGGPATAFWERYLKGTTVPDPFSAQRPRNFEDMLEECTRLSDSLWAASTESRTGECASCAELAGARELGELIRRELVQAFADPDASALPESPWISLLDQVLAGLEGGGRAAGPVPLFTTNYDTAFASLQDGLEAKGIHLETGFVRRSRNQHVWSANAVEQALTSAHRAARSLVYLPLHGSVSWEDVNGETVEYFGKDGKLDLRPEGKTLIWPAVHKQPFDDPFWTHHEWLVRCLQRASAVLFIGYGFRDQAIVALMRMALRSRLDRVRTVVLDRASEAPGRAIHPEFGCLGPTIDAHLPRDFSNDSVPRVLEALGLVKPPARVRRPRATPSSPPPTVPSSSSRHSPEEGASRLQLELKEHLSGARAERTDLGTWVLEGGEWSVKTAEATSTSSSKSWKHLVSPREYAAFAVQLTLQLVTPGHNWGGLALFWQAYNRFLMFQAQGARLKVKWNASHEREYVPPPDRRLDMHAPVNFYCVYDTDGLRFAAVQPPAGVVAYYETTELTGRSGRLGLVVRDQNFQARFSNVCVVPLD